MIFPFLSLLSIGAGAGKVLTSLANLTEGAQIIDYICMCITYIHFHRALAAQGISRSTLPYRGYFQPYCAWIGLCAMIFTVTVYGYEIFVPGRWKTGDFFSYYTMLFVCPMLYTGWKLTHRENKLVRAENADLQWDKKAIDDYEATCVERQVGFWREVGEMLGFIKKKVVQVE